MTNLKPYSSIKRKKPINKVINEREITTDTTEIHRIIKECYEQLYANTFDNQGETDKFLEIYDLPELNQEEI